MFLTREHYMKQIILFSIISFLFISCSSTKPQDLEINHNEQESIEDLLTYKKSSDEYSSTNFVISTKSSGDAVNSKSFLT